MRTPDPRRSLFLVALGLGALSGCSIFAPVDCTLIGCINGLTVGLTSPPTGPYSVELHVPGAEEPFHVYECDGGPSCHHYIHSPRLNLKHVSITVTTVAGSVVTDVPNVEYQRTWPNGRHCPPPCVQATVTAEVPA
ncbi:MAG: hypothetical protein OXU69_00115 [Gemmatimonadota bacterium]|nr:hypothetical protein [Gammaproteobacteria bacterium]MDE2983083.1 hypothetical protein [Gemmatimonadota bacterium]